MIRFQCPACQKVLKAPPEWTGRKTKCMRCGQRFLVPPPPAPADAPPAVENQTVLGQVLPPPTDDVPEESADVPQLADDSLTVCCPGCGRAIPVQAHELPLTIECAQCKACFMVTHPGSESSPVQQSAAVHFDGTGASAAEVEPDRAGAHAGSAGNYVRSALVTFGAVLLIVGLFCPMFTAPMGFSISFVDWSTKTAWLLVKAISEVMDRPPPVAGKAENPPGAPKERRPTQETPETRQKPETATAPAQTPSVGEKDATLLLGLVLTAVSPFCPPSLLCLALLALVLALRGALSPGGSRRWGYLVVGALCFLVLAVLFAGPMLVVWSLPDLVATVIVAAVSLGFGWGLLLAGSILVLAAGFVG
jgi:hypothetical protein